MFKFALKVGLASGAVYYVSEQGVWGNSIQTTKLSQQMYANVKPYVDQAQTQIPVKIPELPDTNQVSYLTKQFWNKGVSATFVFLGDLPQHVSTWTKKGVDATMNNVEIKKFTESFSASPAIEPQKK